MQILLEIHYAGSNEKCAGSTNSLDYKVQNYFYNYYDLCAFIMQINYIQNKRMVPGNSKLFSGKIMLQKCSTLRIKHKPKSNTMKIISLDSYLQFKSIQNYVDEAVK